MSSTSVGNQKFQTAAPINYKFLSQAEPVHTCFLGIASHHDEPLFM